MVAVREGAPAASGVHRARGLCGVRLVRARVGEAGRGPRTHPRLPGLTWFPELRRPLPRWMQCVLEAPPLQPLRAGCVCPHPQAPARHLEPVRPLHGRQKGPRQPGRGVRESLGASLAQGQEPQEAASGAMGRTAWARGGAVGSERCRKSLG